MDFYEFLIQDHVISDAIHDACSFFNMPEAQFKNAEGVCVWTNNPMDILDDIFGVNREQLSDMGLVSDDSITLAYTHECAHRALQNYQGFDQKTLELACDYFTGIYAEMKDVDSTVYENALEQTVGGDSHPEGCDRGEIIRYGKTVVQEMNEKGITPTFENCMEKFVDFIQQEDSNPNPSKMVSPDTVSFGSGYSKSQYVEKANNCYKEADIYADKAERADNPSDKQHYLDLSKKWRTRGDEYMREAKYADA